MFSGVGSIDRRRKRRIFQAAGQSTILFSCTNVVSYPRSSDALVLNTLGWQGQDVKAVEGKLGYWSGLSWNPALPLIVPP